MNLLRLRAGPLLALAAVGLALLAPAPALGHAELVSSSPPANASLVEPPDELVLTFSEAVDSRTVQVRLLDERRDEVRAAGPPGVGPDGLSVRLALDPLEAGTYTVDYQVTSAVDGHVTSGLFAFLVDPTGTQPAPAIPEETSSPSSEPGAVVSRWVALGGTLAAAGIVIFWVLSARPALRAVAGGATTTAPWFAIAAVTMAAAAGLVVHLLIAARPIVEGGAEAAGWFPLDPAGPFGWTPFAIAMRLALIGLLAAALLAAARGAFGDREPAWLAAVGLALGLALAGMSMAGHASAGGLPFGLLDLVHMLAVATWLGTLTGVMALAAGRPGAVGAALRRHSRVALAAAPVVLLTGIANSPLVLGDDPRELVGSGYGNLLLGKAVLFSLAAGIGAANFLLVRSGARRGRVLPLVAAELAVAAAAVLLAAGMVTGQPAAGRVPQLSASSIGTVHLYGTAGDSTVHAAINLPAPGQQRYQVSVSDSSTGSYRTDVQRVFLVLTPPAGSDLPAERVTLQPADEPWLYGATGAYTPLVGTWQVEVVVRRAGELDESASFSLDVVEQPVAEVLPLVDEGIGVPAPLAAAWRLLPAGPVAWALVIFLLGAGAVLFAMGRQTHRPGVRAIRTMVITLAVAIGLATGSRAVVEVANQPPAAAAARSNPVPADARSIARGRDLYLANCASCHGRDGAGDGPLSSQQPPGPRPLARTVPPLGDGALAYRIAAGTAGTPMPGFAATLSAADRWDIVNYLRARWPQ